MYMDWSYFEQGSIQATKHDDDILLSKPLLYCVV